MQETHSIMLPVLGETIRTVLHAQVPDERKAVLQPLVNYVQARVDTGDEINLNFICTHNSRRSQFSQIWAKTASEYFGLKTNCFSGGIEVTAFNERAVSAIERSGFAVTSEGSTNPHYAVRFSAHAEPIAAFSKMYDDPENASGAFAAVMTCSHAEENCPFIPRCREAYFCAL